MFGERCFGRRDCSPRCFYSLELLLFCLAQPINIGFEHLLGFVLLCRLGLDLNAGRLQLSELPFLLLGAHSRFRRGLLVGFLLSSKTDFSCRDAILLRSFTLP